MLTNNFVSAYKAAVEGVTSYGKYVFHTTTNIEEKMDGVSGKGFLTLNNSNALADTDFNTCILVIGTGSAPELPTDYTLASMITDNSIIKVISQSSVIYYGESNSSLGVVARTVQNISADPIAIAEIGLIAHSSKYSSCLLYREVLESPVTLQPGEKHTFTLDLCVA